MLGAEPAFALRSQGTSTEEHRLAGHPELSGELLGEEQILFGDVHHGGAELPDVGLLTAWADGSLLDSDDDAMYGLLVDAVEEEDLPELPVGVGAPGPPLQLLRRG